MSTMIKKSIKHISPVRRQYLWKLAGRIVIFSLCVFLYICFPNSFHVLDGMNFFSDFSVLHILWLIWVTDMVLQIVPIKNKLPIGSMKMFADRFKPICSKTNYEALKRYVVTTTKAAYKVFLLWCALIALIGVLFFSHVISKAGLFMISVLFYVCDLICVLIWCPFRLLMKTRCCTTCRIFNWDHLMMFSPLIFVGGFYSISLVVLALLAFLVWEICILMYPERFWDHTNAALKCSECTDKLCTQYCQKLRN